MSGAHVHLLLNHVPILGTLFALLVLFFGTVRKKEEVVRAGLLAMVLVALVTLPAYLSGEEAEHVLKRRLPPDVSTILIEEHQEAALPAMLTVEGAGLLALLTLVLGRGGRPRPRGLLAVTLIAVAVGFGLVAWVGNLGGQIRHSEVRPGAQDASPAAGGPGPGH